MKSAEYRQAWNLRLKQPQCESDEGLKCLQLKLLFLIESLFVDSCMALKWMVDWKRQYIYVIVNIL